MSDVQHPADAHTATEKQEQPSNGLLTVPQQNEGASSSRTSLSENGLEKAAEPVEEKPPREASGMVWILIVVSILSSTFLFALDNTIVADVQPAIIERFGSIDKLPWLSVSFLLGAIGTNLVWGKIYGQFNAKWLYIFCLFLFEGGSAICGAAPSMDALIVARAICGVGGSGMYVGVMTLLSVNTTPRERPTYIGMTGLTWGAGTVLGPIIGGAFTDSAATWRWAFYINLVVGGLFAPVYIFLLPGFDPRPDVKTSERVKEIDYLGTVLIIGAFTSGVMAISFGGTTYAWNSGRIIGLFVTSGVLFILFGLQQVYCFLTTEARRLFPVHFVKNWELDILFAQTAAAGSSFFVPIYFIPLFFQFTRGDGALTAGVRLLPFVFILVFFVMLNGGLLSKYGLYQPWYLVGGIFIVIGSALMFTVTENTSTATVYGYSILIGVGGGMFAQSSFSVAQTKVPPAEIALAIGFITCGQILGVTITLAIANSIFINQSANNIVAVLPNVDRHLVESAIAGAGSSFFKTLDDATRQQIIHIIVQSMGRTYILGITAGALAVVLSLFMKRERMVLEMAAAA